MISDNNIYIPKVGDHIIGIITNKNNDYYTVNINNLFNGYVMCIDGFRGTTKKYKPALNIGTFQIFIQLDNVNYRDVIFCYVYSVNNNNLIELSCITTDDNKNWSTNETYFGQLSGGFLFPVPLNYIKILYGEDNLVTQLLSNLKYEIVLGFNGRYDENSTLS
ncbi:uncharacterized protein TA02595 [Theileria annulata]|uniref:Uncharacterized protein n=1 Tax=Theileria annulata TaxID=5874 RepID=Q4UD22_THEAN|nr:uncharacterized protein TA02595 [Theileria annulata]CAI75279.1 hypothetical protein, conserved [Theileria annulata]|eukprot:XP_954755.1 hypothetical protein, conserved [Theileria annulata]